MVQGTMDKGGFKGVLRPVCMFLIQGMVTVLALTIYGTSQHIAVTDSVNFDP